MCDRVFISHVLIKNKEIRYPGPKFYPGSDDLR